MLSEPVGDNSEHTNHVGRVRGGSYTTPTTALVFFLVFQHHWCCYKISRRGRFASRCHFARCVAPWDTRFNETLYGARLRRVVDCLRKHIVGTGRREICTSDAKEGGFFSVVETLSLQEVLALVVILPATAVGNTGDVARAENAG